MNIPKHSTLKSSCIIPAQASGSVSLRGRVSGLGFGADAQTEQACIL